MNEFLQRLKQRKLVQWALAYVAAAFALLQGVDIVASRFGWPEQTMRFVIIALSVGMFVTLVLAWYHGERGAQRINGTELLILALLLAIGGGFLWRFGSVARPPVVTSAAAPAAVPATSISEKSIAVLPFENLSSDKENAYFSDGVQDEVLTDLAKIADLKVISRTSVMQYKGATQRNLREIGQQLGVAHVVEGSVQRANNRVRVNAQLIDARNDLHLWAQTYDRDLADVFAIQSEIAKAIADQLQAKLSPAEKSAIEQRPTADVPAFELYSRANSLMLDTSLTANLRQKILTAVDLLNQALARDPSFFLAQCQLAQAHDLLYMIGGDHTPARLALAEAAVDQAVQLRPDAGEAHRARGEHLYRGYLNYDGALAELESARRTLPNDPRIAQLTGAIDRRRGKLADGLRNFQRALEFDPRNLVTLQQLSIFYSLLRRFPEEVAILDRALAINPADVTSKAARAAVFLDWKADTRPLHQAIDEISAQQPAEVAAVADAWFFCALAERDAGRAEAALAALGTGTFGDGATVFGAPFGEGLLARTMGDEAKARRAFTSAREQQQRTVQAQPNYGPPLCVLALIDAALGQKEEALREIRRAIELMPIEKDALNGADMIYYSAMVAAWVEDKDAACRQLQTALQLPTSISYGRLKLLPWWDPLRGDPRFEKIVSSLAPEQP